MTCSIYYLGESVNYGIEKMLRIPQHVCQEVPNHRAIELEQRVD